MRRIMRPSADDAGQPAPGGEAAAPDAAAPIGEPNPGANPFARPAAAEGQEQPAAEADAAGAGSTAADSTGGDAVGDEGVAPTPAADPTAAEEQPVAADQPTQVLPATDAQPAEGAAAAAGEQPADATAAIPAAPLAPKRGLFRRRPKPVLPVEGAEPAPVAEAAVVLPAAEGPAGLDPAEAELRPPAGRRGRLRRRLRYLRRARELMLRDLGGLVFEIHRTGGGDMTSHAPIVAGKVERLSRLDAESVALETALDTPRAETVVFQPGVGGTCVVCGELYPSTAKFCSECGTSTTAVVVTEDPVVAPEPGTGDVEQGGSLGFAKAGPTQFTSGDPLAQRPGADPAAATGETETPGAEPAAESGEAETPGPEPAASDPAAEAGAPETGSEPAAAEDGAAGTDEPNPATGTPGAEPAASEPAATEPERAEGEPGPARNEPERNGVVPPTLSPGDPLASRKQA